MLSDSIMKPGERSGLGSDVDAVQMWCKRADVVEETFDFAGFLFFGDGFVPVDLGVSEASIDVHAVGSPFDVQVVTPGSGGPSYGSDLVEPVLDGLLVFLIAENSDLCHWHLHVVANRHVDLDVLMCSLY